MKKLALLMVLLLIINVLAGCGGSGGGSNTGVSGDSSLTTEIISLLNAISSAYVNGDAEALADCAYYPLTVEILGYTYEDLDYSQFLSTYTTIFNIIDFSKYIITNATFDSTTGSVSFKATYTASSEGQSASGVEEVVLHVANDSGKWKFNEWVSEFVDASSQSNNLRPENYPAQIKNLLSGKQ